MRKSIGGIVLATVVAAVPLAAGCTADAADEPYTKGDVTWANSDQIALRGMVAVADGPGNAVLSGTLLNQGDRPDRLTAVGVPGGGASKAVVPLAANAVKQLSHPQITLKSPRIVLGGTVRLTFDFERAAPIELDVLVVPRTGPYENVARHTPSRVRPRTCSPGPGP